MHFLGLFFVYFLGHCLLTRFWSPILQCNWLIYPFLLGSTFSPLFLRQSQYWDQCQSFLLFSKFDLHLLFLFKVIPLSSAKKRKKEISLLGNLTLQASPKYKMCFTCCFSQQNAHIYKVVTTDFLAALVLVDTTSTSSSSTTTTTTTCTTSTTTTTTCTTSTSSSSTLVIT